MAGQPTGSKSGRAGSEQVVSERLGGLRIDMTALAGVSNIHRTAGVLRHHLERSVLAPYDLTWTGWEVLQAVWVGGDMQPRQAAAEAGISAGTLTGVARTLTKRGLLDRRVHPDDARHVLLSLTAGGRTLMQALFPAVNQAATAAVQTLTRREISALVSALDKLVLTVSAQDGTAATGASIAVPRRGLRRKPVGPG